MIKVQSVNLYDIIPQILKKDETTVAICKVLQKYVDENFNLINKLILLPNIDNLAEDILDHIAYQFHVDFYESDLPLSVKQQLVKNSMQWHKIKGTRAALEQMLATIYHDIKVEEWFEYEDSFILDGSWRLNGDNLLDYNTVKKAPYYFRVILKSFLESNINTSSIGKIIELSKNTRSWLDVILFFLKGRCKTQEKYNLETIIHRIFCSFNREGLSLDGKWKLDGEYLLDNNYEAIILKITNRFTIQKFLEGLFNEASLTLECSFKSFNTHKSEEVIFLFGLNFWYRNQVFLNGKWLLDGEYLLDSDEINKKKPLSTDIKNRVSLKGVENFSTTRIVIEKNLWTLNGESTLGEGRLLDAEIIEEVI